MHELLKGGVEVVIAALEWPEAVVWATGILGASLVLCALIWSIFQTGRTAISSEGDRRKES
jgi:hypothetical protein